MNKTAIRSSLYPLKKRQPRLYSRNDQDMKSILIIGTGSIGERHLRCFLATGRRKVAACEPNESLRKTIQEKYGCVVYASLDEALAAEAWDATVICTPAHTHIPIARQCVERGSHVLIEKPLSVSLEGIEELVTLASAKQVAVRVAYVHRSIPVVMAVRDIVRSGKIGEVRHVVVKAGQNFPGARPAYASTYYAKRASGGGCIQDGLTHVLHAVEWIIGPIERVYCDATHEALATKEVEDTVNLVARLRGNVPAAFTINQFQAPNEVTLSFNGLLGSVRAELHYQRYGILLMGESDWTWFDMPQEERDAMFIRQAEAFLDSTEGRPDYLSTLEDGLQTLKVNLAALKSSDTHQEVII